MSLTDMKAKGKNGKKKKISQQMKTILASPYQKRIPTLMSNELEELGEFLEQAMKDSGIDQHAFAKKSQIYLGLEDVLCGITERRISCLFLSLSLKPRFVINLIARDSEVKNSTVPVYTVAHLEQFAEKMYGIGAYALALPAELKIFGEKLESWVEARKNPPKADMSMDLSHRKSSTKPKKKCEASKNFEKVQPLSEMEEQTKDEKDVKHINTCKDFIPLSDLNCTKGMNVKSKEEDKAMLINALNKMAQRVQVEGSSIQKDSEKIILEDKKDANATVVNRTSDNIDSDEFLHKYQPLQIYKISVNPHRKKNKKGNKGKTK